MARWSTTLSLPAFIVVVLTCIAAVAEDNDNALQVQFFEKQIRPLLIEHCHECHAGKEHKGGLRLDSRQAMLQGGDSGAAIVPGDADASLLIDAVRYGDIYQMPPEGKLSDAEVAALTTWVSTGALWPNSQPSLPATDPADAASSDTEGGLDFWSFQPPVDPAIPSVVDQAWPQSDLDYFVLAKLEATGLKPAPRADRRTLIRRATFDLTGLPPTPEEIANFLADESPQAFARLIDRLLSSPRYGERWGRHWLDVARYADSNGLDENMAFANAYRYRDYVIDSFNSDVPFDQFVREQIAGDLLPAENDAAKRRNVVATGFLSIGAKMLAEDDPVKMEMDIIDEQIDTLGRAFCGMTFGCARCHDHKFDPVSTAEYYALAGIFKSTKTMENFKVVANWHERPLMTDELEAEVEAHQQQLAASQSAYDALLNETMGELQAEVIARAGEYLLAAWQLSQQPKSVSRLNHGDDGSSQQATVVEAEQFSEGNVLTDTTGYGAGIGVILNRGELPNVAEYEVSVASEGYYQLELRFAAAASRPVQIFVDDLLVNAVAAGDVTGTWNPDSQRWAVGCVLPLAVGSHSIRLVRDGPFPHFDKLALVPIVEAADEQPVMTPEQVATAEGLHVSVLRRWVDEFEAGDNAPMLAQLFAAISAEATDDETFAKLAASSSAAEALLADPRPSTPQELASRFGDLFQEARGLADEQLTDAQREIRNLVEDESGSLIPANDIGQFVAAADAEAIAKLREELKQLEEAKPQVPHAMAVEEGEAQDLQIHIRGNHLILGDQVSRGLPRVMASHVQPTIAPGQSGRLELAFGITRDDHPLTSRVMANRIWRWHFGQGLVATTDNFGLLGSPPSHPQLLDWLAVRFVEDGWSIKEMHRTIMLSATYQMSAALDRKAIEQDPENILLWRSNRGRLEAEAIRDSLLAVSGQLDEQMGGSLLGFKNHTYVTSTASKDSVNYATPRRSVYLPVVRSALYDFLHVFDFAEPSVPSGDRASTTIAPQALFMLNSDLMIEASRHLAMRLLNEVKDSPTGRIKRMYELTYGRPPTTEESLHALEFIIQYTEALSAEGTNDAYPTEQAWAGLCRAILASNEFVFVE